MKLIIAGTRDLDIDDLFMDRLIGLFICPHTPDLPKNFEIVSGGASGIDSCGECFARGLDIKVTRFPANWEKHGKAAGPIRNKEMAKYADALLLIWNGVSHGSANMKDEMRRLNKPIYEVVLRKHNV